MAQFSKPPDMDKSLKQNSLGKTSGKSPLVEMLDPYPSALEIVYGENMRPDPEAEEPPEFVAAPDTYELIEGMYGKP